MTVFLYVKELLLSLEISIEDKILKEAIKRSQPAELNSTSPSEKMANLETHFIRNSKTKQYKEGTCYSEKDLDFVSEKLKQYNLHALELFPQDYQTILQNNPWEIWYRQ